MPTDSSSGSGAKRSRRSRVSVERVGPEHEPLLLAFFRKEWGGEGGTGDPGFDASIPQWVCIRNDEAIGYLGTIPVALRVGGVLAEASWLKGFWVSEAYRSGPVGPMLLEQAASELDLIGSQVVDRAAWRVLESYGLSHRCTLFNRVLLLRAGRVASRIDPERVGFGGLPWIAKAGVKTLQKLGVMGAIGGLAGVVFRLPGVVSNARSRHYSARVGWDVDPGALNGLWERLRDQVHTTPERSATSLVERYATGPHELVTVWSGEELVGWAVVRSPRADADPRLSGVRVASIADVFFPIGEPAVGRRALGAAEDLARGQGADALLCSGSHPALERHLTGRGYVRFPGSVRIMARDGRDHAFATGGENMWVTRGDARSDEVF